MASFKMAAMLAAFLCFLLVFFQLSNISAFSSTLKGPTVHGSQVQASAKGTSYLLGVGKADITGCAS